MDLTIQFLGVSMIAFPLIWLMAGRRQQVRNSQKIVVVVVGILATALSCSAFRYGSQRVFGDFVISNPGLGLLLVFLVGAPLSFAFVITRLMRPLRPEPSVGQQSPFQEPARGVADGETNLPAER